VFKQTPHGRRELTETHSDWLFPRFQLLSPKTTERGACISVRQDQSFNKIDTFLHCVEQTLEVHTVELDIKSSNLRILALYRTPSANLNQFKEKLDATLKYLYNSKPEFLISGDMIVDYPNDNWKKQFNFSYCTFCY
jgi:hypothetical protein